MDQSADEDVAAAFSGGRPDALSLVYERFGPLVYSIALRSLGAQAGRAGHVAAPVGVRPASGTSGPARPAADPGRP